MKLLLALCLCASVAAGQELRLIEDLPPDSCALQFLGAPQYRLTFADRHGNQFDLYAAFLRCFLADWEAYKDSCWNDSTEIEDWPAFWYWKDLTDADTTRPGPVDEKHGYKWTLHPRGAHWEHHRKPDPLEFFDVYLKRKVKR